MSHRDHSCSYQTNSLSRLQNITQSKEQKTTESFGYALHQMLPWSSKFHEIYCENQLLTLYYHDNILDSLEHDPEHKSYYCMICPPVLVRCKLFLLSSSLLVNNEIHNVHTDPKYKEISITDLLRKHCRLYTEVTRQCKLFHNF